MRTAMFKIFNTDFLYIEHFAFLCILQIQLVKNGLTVLSAVIRYMTEVLPRQPSGNVMNKQINRYRCQ